MAIDLAEHYARFPDEMTLGEAREILRGQMATGGGPCPTCTKNTEIYHRPLNRGMARALARMYLIAGHSWLHKPTVLRGFDSSARDDAYLRFWGLLEPRVHADGKQVSGVWRVTPDGARFIAGDLLVPRKAKEFNGRFLGYLDPTDLISISDALRAPFDLEEMRNELTEYRDTILALPQVDGIVGGGSDDEPLAP